MIIADAPKGVIHPHTAAACLREGITTALAGGAVESGDAWHPLVAVQAIGVTAVDHTELPEISIHVSGYVDATAGGRLIDRIATTGTAPGYEVAGTALLDTDESHGRMATQPGWPNIWVYTDRVRLPDAGAIHAGGTMLAACIDELDPEAVGWIRSATLHFPAGSQPAARGIVSLWTPRRVGRKAQPEVSRMWATSARGPVDVSLELQRTHHKFED